MKLSPCFSKLTALFKKKQKLEIIDEFSSKYSLGKLLGKGAFANVYEASRNIDLVHVAVKVIEKSGLQKGDEEVIQNEINVLRQLHHKNTTGLVDFFETAEKYYLVMELASGGELFDRILSKGYYTEVDAAKIISQLLEGIAHRDLKPENLLFRDSSETADLLITDFGLSKSLTTQEYLKTCCAPEILLGSGHGLSVDMWAVGVITFVLLCGYTPFWGGENNSNVALFKAIAECNYEFEAEYWSLISSEAKDFITKLLLKDQSSRMTVSEALAHPWLFTTQTADLLPNVRKNFNAKMTFKKGKFSNSLTISAAIAIKMIHRAKKLSIPNMKSKNPPTIG
ncbi:calcium calmodulin-dependent protein kinase type 1G [Globomyces sp. JEL0801]|nr:calcium calmodulin-dependent protein kinase type 1G [Globomyces sp. JEL0801]